MKIALCDDEKDFLADFSQRIKALPYVTMVDCFFSFNGLVDELCNEEYDVIMMDLEWHKKQDGMDIAAELWKRRSPARIVYVTGYIDKFVENTFIKKANVAGFLVKPISDEKLKRCLDSLLTESDEERDCINIHIQGKTILIKKKEILYMESRDHYVDIFMENEQYRTWGRLGDYEKKLADVCLRCHKGYLINMEYIRAISAVEIDLKNGRKLPIGRKYMQSVKTQFADYLLKKIE